MAAKQEVPSITTDIAPNHYYSSVYAGFDMWRIQWRHLFYDSGIQYGRQTESAIDYHLYLCKSTNPFVI